MAWDPPADADLAPDKPAKASHARRIRDLFEALAARDTGAPWLNGIGAIQVLRNWSHNGTPGAGNALDGPFVVPDGVTRIEVMTIGGGGAGGKAFDTIGSDGPSGGGGGGAGAVRLLLLEVTPGEVFPVRVGAGGSLTVISPYVDTSLDDFEIGDGARTVFGVYPRIVVSGGGKRGFDGDGGANQGEGGEGGGIVLVGDQPINPNVYGAKGGQAFRSAVSGSGPLRSGRGAASILGPGGAGRVTGVGANAAVCPGAGGGGAYPDAFSSITNGGNGANGAVIVRY